MMSKLLYEIIKESNITSEVVINIQDLMDKAEIIRIDNVADYYWLHEQQYWDIREDFPNIAPPFPVFWMEYTHGGKAILDGKLYDNLPSEGMKVGHLFVSEKHSTNGWSTGVVTCLFHPNRGIYKTILNNPIAMLQIDRYGNPILNKGVLEYGIPEKLKERLIMPSEDYIYMLTMNMFVPLLAISFMHCKNVVIETNQPKRGRHNRNMPKITYKTLVIEPMKTVLKNEGGIEQVGLKKALHICRGHFKDFREKGLFGRYHDIFWWESQVRGNIANGIVNKDYAINPPTPE
jgi:hypothetical protein